MIYVINVVNNTAISSFIKRINEKITRSRKLKVVYSKISVKIKVCEHMISKQQYEK